MGLSNKRRQFVREYLVDFNATQAAIRCGYSPKTAYSIGYNLLKIVEVDQAIKAAIAEKMMGVDEVLTRLADIARGDMGEFLDISSMGFQIDMDAAKRKGLTKLIKKVKMRTTTTTSSTGDDRETHDIEIELYDAQAALNTLARHHALLTDKTELSGDIEFTVRYSDDGNAEPKTDD